VSVAWLFPGQGSHSIGMAGAWCARSAEARAALAEAADVLGFDLPGLIANGPAKDLDDTHNQQPAVLATCVAILRAARAAGLLPDATLVAGHSLGEFGALVAAGSLSYPDALRLVRERGRLMKAAGEQGPGRMLAVLGLSDTVVEAACQAHPGAQVANYNAPGQVVISGATVAVDAAAADLRVAGAKRLVPLPITIAAHSALMAPAASLFARAVDSAPFALAGVPVVVNGSAEPLRAPDDLRRAVAAQLTSPVRWTASVQRMVAEGVTTFYEVGPGAVLGGLVRRIVRDVPDREFNVVALAEPPD
jgi:[acyl-carrier-protein] S-malonyltransferase